MDLTHCFLSKMAANQNRKPTWLAPGDNDDCVVLADDCLKYRIGCRATVKPTLLWLSEGQISTTAHCFPLLILQVVQGLVDKVWHWESLTVQVDILTCGNWVVRSGHQLHLRWPWCGSTESCGWRKKRGGGRYWYFIHVQPHSRHFSGNGNIFCLVQTDQTKDTTNNY